MDDLSVSEAIISQIVIMPTFGFQWHAASDGKVGIIVHDDPFVPVDGNNDDSQNFASM